jgi:hypothetical protein
VKGLINTFLFQKLTPNQNDGWQWGPTFNSNSKPLCHLALEVFQFIFCKKIFFLIMHITTFIEHTASTDMLIKGYANNIVLWQCNKHKLRGIPELDYNINTLYMEFWKVMQISTISNVHF